MFLFVLLWNKKNDMKTPDPKFILKESKSEKPTPIFLIARFGEEKFKYSTSETILPALWDFDSQTPTTKIELIKEHNVLKSKLTDIRNRIALFSSFFIETFEALKRSGETITSEILKTSFDKKFKPNAELETKPPKKKEISFFEWIEKYSQEVKLNFKGEPIKPRTRKKYITTLHHLIDFSREKKIKVNFDNINSSFYEEFVSYLFSEKKFSINKKINFYIK